MSARIVWPRATPPASKTSHGIPMSDACARFYVWLKDNGVNLWTFSTDNCVERVLPRLQEMYAWTEAPTDADQTFQGYGGMYAPCSTVELAAVRDQLRRVMQRRPSARVAPTERGRLIRR